MLFIKFKHKKIVVNLKQFILATSCLIISIILAFIFINFCRYPEIYLSTWRYQLKNDIYAKNKNSIKLYENVYVKHNKDLFKDNFAIRNIYTFDTNVFDYDICTNPNIIKCEVTAYCGCCKCCSKYDKMTASGVKAVEGITIAADTNKLPFGTNVEIDGHVYTVQDKGGVIKGNRIDIYFDSHERALKYGRQIKDVIIY